MYFIYSQLVYANNDSGDGADVVFQKSTDEGASFSAPVKINAALRSITSA